MTSFINYDTVVDLTTIAPISEVPIYNANKIQGIEVTDDSPSDGDVLVYNSITGKYELEQPVIVNPDSPIFNANRLQGIDLPELSPPGPGPSVNDILVYNGTAYEYQAVLDPDDPIFNANQLRGKLIPETEPANNDILVYDGDEQKYVFEPYLDPDEPDYNANKIQGVEVTTDTPNNGEALVYDIGTMKYELQATPDPTDSIYNAKQLQGIEITIDTPNNGEALVYNNVTLKYELQEIVGVNTVQDLTNKSFEDSTTYFYDELDNTKRLQFDCSDIDTNTVRTLIAPNANDTIAVLDEPQTFTNKTLTRPIITSENAPVGTLGMFYYDTTLNLLAFYNGIFWQYIGIYIPIKVQIYIENVLTDFYSIPIVTAMDDLPASNPMSLATGATRDIWPTNGWSASSTGANPNRVTYTLLSNYASLSLSTSVQFNYIQYNFGSQPAGVYSVIFVLGSLANQGIITVTEQTTGVEICKVDPYRNIGTSTANVAPVQYEFPFIFNGNAGVSANLVVRWAANTKNDSSSGFAVRLCNYIQLTRIG